MGIHVELEDIFSLRLLVLRKHHEPYKVILYLSVLLSEAFVLASHSVFDFICFRVLQHEEKVLNVPVVTVDGFILIFIAMHRLYQFNFAFRELVFEFFFKSFKVLPDVL